MNYPEHLSVNEADLNKKVSGPKRYARVDEAIGWEKGTPEELIYHTTWESDVFSVKLGKPGKEALPTFQGPKGINSNDMKPVIFKDGSLFDDVPKSFTEIFDELQMLMDKDEHVLEIIGCLLVRSAYMIDHTEIEEGIWRYTPPKDVIAEITRVVPLIGNVPTEVFLHYLDVLGWNEDVKYSTFDYDIGGDYGRKNNILTCVNLIGVLLKRVRISKFAGSFSRPPSGISAISKKNALEVFPYLTAE